MFVSSFSYHHNHFPLLWITERLVGSALLKCTIDIPIVQASEHDVSILFGILYIFIYLYCGLLGCELAQLNVDVR